MKQPTPVQVGIIPAAIAGRDCIGVAETGSGKTAAFVLPILHHLCKDPYGVYALIMSPTRELALQLDQQVEALGRSCNIRHLLVVGGLDQFAQATELRKRPHVVVATPGRLAEILNTSAELQQGFKRTAVLVLDEADRVLEKCFEQPLRVIIKTMSERRQTLLFTATMTPPLEALQKNILKDPCIVKLLSGLTTASNLKEQYILVPAKVKEVFLMHILGQLEDFQVRSAIIFCARKHSCELLGGLLHQLECKAVTLHGDKKQKARLASLHQFKSGTAPLLVATDLASRGLDIPTVDLVVNFDLPVSAEDYIHRVGRTARAGRGGWSLTLVTQYDIDLVYEIEAVIGHKLEPFEVDEDAATKDITRIFAAKRAAMLAFEAQKAR
eukprot:jgi/Ulvmu1/6963/UM033_0020.1